MYNLLKVIGLYLLFLLLAFACYQDAWQGAFVSDFHQWIDNLPGRETEAGYDIWSFGSHIYGYVYLLHGLYHLFGFSEVQWFLSSLAPHALTASVLFYLLRAIAKRTDLSATLLPWAGSLFFLISPYQTEVVVWAAGIHYLSFTFCIVLALYALVRYFDDAPLYTALVFHLLFISAVLFHEQPLVFSGLSLVVFLFLRNYLFLSVSWLRYGLYIILPQVIIYLSYFLTQYYWYNTLVGHYGAEAHFDFELMELLTGYWVYMLKFVSLLRYWIPFENGYRTRDFMQQDTWVIGFTLLLLVGLVYLSYRYWYRQDKRARLLLLFLCLGAIALFPVLNLGTLSLIQVQTDRYGYLASIFVYSAIGVGLSYLPLKWGKVVLTCLLVVHGFFLWQTARVWEKTGELMNGLAASLNYKYYDQVYVLGLPDNYRGVYMYRRGWYGALRAQHGVAPEGKVFVLSTYEWINPDDTLKIETQPYGISVSVPPGSWYSGVGEDIRYEGEAISMDMQQGLWYNLHIPCRPHNTVFVYPVGNRFHQVPLVDIPNCQP